MRSGGRQRRQNLLTKCLDAPTPQAFDPTQALDAGRGVFRQTFHKATRQEQSRVEPLSLSHNYPPSDEGLDSPLHR